MPDGLCYSALCVAAVPSLILKLSTYFQASSKPTAVSSTSIICSIQDEFLCRRLMCFVYTIFFVFERFSCGLFCSSMHVYVLLQITLFVASMRIKIFIKLKRVEGRRINQSCVVSGCVSSKSSGTHHSSVLVLAPLRH